VNIATNWAFRNETGVFMESDHKNGTEIVYRIPEVKEIFDCHPAPNEIQIRWDNTSSAPFLNETMSYRLSYYQNRIPYENYLINSESVNINFFYRNNTLQYHMDARFILNATVINQISPESVWFPENGTDCSADLEYCFEGGKYENKLLKSKRFPALYQRGFLIDLPDEFERYDDRLIEDPVMNVYITGTLPKPWFDFVIVTIPQEESTIRISTPRSLNITHFYSTFEEENLTTTNLKNILTFSGKCNDYGPIHIEWDYSHINNSYGLPEINEKSQNSTSKNYDFNQRSIETVYMGAVDIDGDLRPDFFGNCIEDWDFRFRVVEHINNETDNRPINSGYVRINLTYDIYSNNTLLYPDENGEVFLTFDSLPLNTSDQTRWQLSDHRDLFIFTINVTYYDENDTLWCGYIFYCTLNGPLTYDPYDPTFLEEHPNFIRNSLCGSLILIVIALMIFLVRSQKKRIDFHNQTIKST
jgi:hypothetical protein